MAGRELCETGLVRNGNRNHIGFQWIMNYNIFKTCLFLVLVIVGIQSKAEQLPDAPAAPQIFLFSQPYCPGCEAAKAYFKSNQLAYTEFDITADARARTAFQQLGARGTPFLLVNGKRLQGFHPVMIDTAIQAGKP